MVQQTINLYAWRENEKMIPPVLITQGESDTRTATFRLLDQATTIDLTGKSISFEYDKPDGFHVSLICQPTENPPVHFLTRPPLPPALSTIRG